MELKIDRSSKIPAYRQLYFQISEQIKEGSIPAGAMLPKIRVLAQDLGIARNTVESAYRQLALEGFATGYRGRGYVVEELDLEPALSSHQEARWSLLHSVSPASPGRDPLGDDRGCDFVFSYGNRSADDFPMHLWRHHANRVFSEEYAKLASSYMGPFGLPALREQLALYLGETRNVVCGPHQIVLLPGTQAALQSICALFAEGQRIVGMEDPGYDAARGVFADCGWEVRPIPTYKSAKAYLSGVLASGARCLFCTPSNQFPLGYIMPISVRLDLISWAKRTGAYIIEDDYCCEYRYDGSSPIPSLQSLDSEHVIYMGTLSKVLTPAIRMSYVVVPESLVPRWEWVHKNHRCSIDWMSQAIVHSLMATGDWHKYVRNTVAGYHHKHEILMSAIKRELGDRVQLMGEKAGLHLLMGDSIGRDQATLIRLAQEKGVRVYETDPYWFAEKHPLDNYVLLGFSSIRNEDIEPGIRALAGAWFA